MNRVPTPCDFPSQIRLFAFWSCMFLLPLGMPLAMAQEESQAAPAIEGKALDEPPASSSSEPTSETETTGPLVQFRRDVMPIFQKRCQSCHGAEDAKADFRIDDRDTVLGYIEPGDAAPPIPEASPDFPPRRHLVFGLTT